MEVTLVVWAVFGVLTAGIANSRGDSAGLWFIVGVLLGPIGLALAWFRTGAVCPSCRRRVHRQASICPHCQSPIEQTERPDRLVDPSQMRETNTRQMVLFAVMALIVVAIAGYAAIQTGALP